MWELFRRRGRWGRAHCVFQKKCYFSDEVDRRHRELRLIRRGRAGWSSYCVVIVSSGEEQLEILRSFTLCLDRYRERPAVVCGVARSLEGAVRVVAEISDDAARAGMPGELRRFVEERGRRR